MRAENRPVPAKEADPKVVRSYLERFGITDEYARCAWYCAGQMGLNGLQRLAELIDPESRNHARLFGMNTDAAQLVGIFKKAAEGDEGLKRWLDLDDRKRFNLIQLGRGRGAGGRPEVGEKAFEEKADEIEQSMERIDMALLLGGMGGGTASGVLPKIAEQLKKRQDRIGALGIATRPFGFEAKRLQRADEALRKLSQFVPVVTIYNQAIYELGDRPEYAELAQNLKENDFEDAIHRVNNNVISPILKTANQLIFSERAVFRRDSEDWRRILESGQAAYIGSYEFEHNENALDDLDQILVRLLEDPFQHQDIVPNSKIALVLFQGSFTPEEVEELTEGIKERMKNGEAAEDVEVIPGYDGQAEGKAIFFLSVAPELPDASKKSSAAESPRSPRQSRHPVPNRSQAGTRLVRDPKSEELNPFNSKTLREELWQPPNGTKTRMVMLRFSGVDGKEAVYVSPKVFELLQYLEFNWKKWGPEESKRNYQLLRDYFLEVHPETRGKKWIPEGIEELPGEASPVTPESRKKLFDSFIPENLKRK